MKTPLYLMRKNLAIYMQCHSPAMGDRTHELRSVMLLETICLLTIVLSK